jgi:hypothetical protein
MFFLLPTKHYFIYTFSLPYIGEIPTIDFTFFLIFCPVNWAFYTISHSICPPLGAEMNGLDRLLCASSMRKGVNFTRVVFTNPTQIILQHLFLLSFQIVVFISEAKSK